MSVDQFGEGPYTTTPAAEQGPATQDPDATGGDTGDGEPSTTPAAEQGPAVETEPDLVASEEAPPPSERSTFGG